MRILLADVGRATNYVAEAKTEFESRSFEQAGKKLELAEAELADVSADEQKPVRAAIAVLRTQLTAEQGSADKQKYARQLQRVMSDGEGAIGNLVTWPGAQRQAEELFKNPAAKAALGAELVERKKSSRRFTR
ncbi:MAG: hypothetical protein QM811_28330 [Pirellulales bacterium]